MVRTNNLENEKMFFDKVKSYYDGLLNQYTLHNQYPFSITVNRSVLYCSN